MSDESAASKSQKISADSDAKHAYDYDLAVIGGGSGGLACAKEAAHFGARVICFDFVKPSPAGTTWGLGGTCVNVGCIPKKLMHYAALIRKKMDDAKELGFKMEPQPTFDWSGLVDGVGNYIGSLNYGYRNALLDANVKYENAYAVFKDAHTLEFTPRKAKEPTRITAANIVIATGGRPNYPNIPGWELGISSDDIFSYYKAPGKTLVVGASYIALECAGFLNELGFETQVMVRSILLRGFDQQCANIIGGIMERDGVKFVRGCTPSRLDKTDDSRIQVTYLNHETNETLTEVFDTVLWAVGRTAVTAGMGIEEAGVKVNPSRKIIVDAFERTSVPHIFAIGDCIQDRPELTPVAIKAGVLLSRRLFDNQSRLMDYDLVPTTVFTPYEYGCVGLSQEEAEKRLGKDNIEVYLSKFGITEFAAVHRKDRSGMDMIKECFAKLICDKTRNELVVGFHIVGPDAGEVTQGYATAMRAGATKKHFDDTVGIHPTMAEEFTTLSVSLSSGLPWEKVGGC